MSRESSEDATEIILNASTQKTVKIITAKSLRAIPVSRFIRLSVFVNFIELLYTGSKVLYCSAHNVRTRHIYARNEKAVKG